MKKLVTLILVMVLLVSCSVSALADCEHAWGDWTFLESYIYYESMTLHMCADLYTEYYRECMICGEWQEMTTIESLAHLWLPYDENGISECIRCGLKQCLVR